MYKLSDSDSVVWFLRLGLLTSLDGLNLTIDLTIFWRHLVAQWEGVPIETRLYGAKLRLRDVKRPYS